MKTPRGTGIVGITISKRAKEAGAEMGLLDGDTALVTGAAGGIGRGIARALAEEGRGWC
jgi:NADP-dependent 3-hydroxy acid dehydrogenase YdfG